MISSMRTICIFVLLLITSSAPCDIFAASNTPCVAAHSTVRALYSTYTGPLYQLLRTIDNATMDIHPLGPGGVADAASHDAFCAGGGGSGGGSGNGLPPMGSVVALSPVGALAKFALRHCYSQAFVTPEADSGADHTFSLQPALNGAMGAISLRSVNYPDEWLAPVSGAEPGRLGIAPTSAFSPAEGSFAVSPAPGGVGITLASLAPAGGLIAVGSNLTGTCAHSYEPPAASVYLLSAPAPSAVTAWTISSTGPPGPASCQIWRVYDQSGRGNTLNVSGPAINNPADNNAVNATRHPLMLNGHKTYGMFFEGGMGYRALNTNGIALDNEPETLYMVTSGTHVNSGCCFDYGNAESQPNNASTFHDGTMEAINFSVTDVSDVWCGGNGTTGPWVMVRCSRAGGCSLAIRLLPLHSLADCSTLLSLFLPICNRRRTSRMACGLAAVQLVTTRRTQH